MLKRVLYCLSEQSSYFQFDPLIIRLPLQKNVLPYHFAKILAKIQEIKAKGTSAERKYANRRLHKTLPRVFLNEENLF